MSEGVCGCVNVCLCACMCVSVYVLILIFKFILILICMYPCECQECACVHARVVWKEVRTDVSVCTCFVSFNFQSVEERTVGHPKGCSIFPLVSPRLRACPSTREPIRTRRCVCMHVHGTFDKTQQQPCKRISTYQTKLLAVIDDAGHERP